jgi:hypothetical protein
MPRHPPRLKPIDPLPTAEDLCSEGAMSIRRAAAFVGLKPAELRPYIERREIRTAKPGTRRVVPKVALIRWLASKLEPEK